ncbi:hypothetical protein QOT17_008676 [Balamuthia mandrillaris]
MQQKRRTVAGSLLAFCDPSRVALSRCASFNLWATWHSAQTIRFSAPTNSVFLLLPVTSSPRGCNGFSTSTKAGTPPTQGKVPLEKWTANELQEWLRASPYAEYAKLFEGLPGVSAARYTEEQLKSLILEASKAIALFNDLQWLNSHTPTLNAFSFRKETNPPVHGLFSGNTEIPGETVMYTPPPIFEPAYMELTGFIRANEAGCLTPKWMRCIFIDGASGCGKSRLGYELFRRMLTDPAFIAENPRHLDCINYAVVNAVEGWRTIDPYDTDTADRMLASTLLTTYGPPSTPIEDMNLSTLLPLLARAQTSFAPYEGRAALILHFDEFPYAIFMEGKYVMQSKGSQLGHALQRSIPPSDVAKMFKQLAQKAPDALALEFLSSRSAPSRHSTLPSLLNPEKHALVFISRETLPEALHPCFANIASRSSFMERPRRVPPRRRGSKTDLA